LLLLAFSHRRILPWPILSLQRRLIRSKLLRPQRSNSRRRQQPGASSLDSQAPANAGFGKNIIFVGRRMISTTAQQPP
jgi:hypothetical protein